MLTTTCTRRFGIDCGHRVKGHGGKCRHLHGHRYTIEVTAVAALNELGMVIDFGDMKATIGAWLDENWDHGFLLWDEDHEAIRAVRQVVDQKLILLPCNPTAENLAEYLLGELQRLVDVRLVSIVVHETPNCSAEATANHQGESQ